MVQMKKIIFIFLIILAVAGMKLTVFAEDSAIITGIEDVTRLQQGLSTLGLYSDDEIDGDYGPVTENAIIAFQKKQNINPDGVPTYELLNRIESISGDSKETLKFKYPSMFIGNQQVVPTGIVIMIVILMAILVISIIKSRKSVGAKLVK